MARFELDKNSFIRRLGRSVNFLIELEHPSFDNTYYFANDTRELTVEGQTYVPFGFDLTPPSQTEQQGTQIIMANVTNEVANQIKKTVYSNTNIVLRLYLATIEQDAAVRYDFGTYEVFAPTITMEAIVATINLRHCLGYNIGGLRYSRQLFKNLYL